jgi:hypothetical protein
MKDSYTINSVLGFDLKSDIVLEENGTTKVLSGGIKSTYHPDDSEGRVEIGSKCCNFKWFTTFNQDLFNKLLDYKQRND